MHARVVLPADDPRNEQFRLLAHGRQTGGRAWTCSQGAPTWSSFLALGQRLEPTHAMQLRVRFSPMDVKRADWAVWSVTGHTGYPQPEEGYLDDVYDTRSMCRLCTHFPGGVRQVAPFRMVGEPRLGNREIMQLHWVPDAWFVTPRVHQAVFAPFGIEARPVLTKGGRELVTVVQLVINEHVPVDEYRTEAQRCDECGTERLHTRLLNYAPLPLGEPTGPLVFTETNYGAGGMRFHETLIRRDLREAIQDAGLRGTELHPCGTSEQRREFELAAQVPAELLEPAPLYILKSQMPNVYELRATALDHSGAADDEIIARDKGPHVEEARGLLARTGGLATTEALMAMGANCRAAGALDEALVMFGRAAQRGHARAMNLTAQLLADEDPESALVWWDRAIEAGDDTARFELGCFYFATDRGDRAREAWIGAVEKDRSVDAMFVLGMMSRDVDGDVGAARLYFERASKGGHELAAEALEALNGE